MKELELLKRRLAREIKARKEAETILEQKAIQLYEANESLQKLNNNLEFKIRQRAKELVNSEEKYRRLIENMELGLLEVDNEQIILRAYDSFCEMTGYEQSELKGKNAQEVFLINNDDSILMDDVQSKRKKGQTGVYELQIKKKNGEPIWVMISGCPVIDINGKVTGSLGIHYDITAQKNLQLELELSKNVAKQAQKAEQLFLARMSHEIRTPLNAIIGMTYLLNDSNPTTEQQDFLSVLNSSSAILKSLIADILDFSKIQAGEIKIQESQFSLHRLLSSVQKSIGFQLSGKVKFELDLDPQIKHLIYGDELMLSQIIVNLLGNAKKFTAKGFINVQVNVVEETDTHYELVFKVMDSGIGISEEKLDFIFQNFKQIQEDDENFGGTGLGLAITKQLVELQGGSISVNSKLNEGSTFTFNLNYKKGIRSDLEKIKPKLQKSKFNQEKILVVEDNYMNRKYILTLLKKWNLKFEIAEDGIEAIAITERQPFDLIFMDISMPKLNGYETTKAIRNDKNNINQSSPIVALSASAFTSIKAKAFEFGMNDFLCKPYDPQSLKAIISKYTQRDTKDDTVLSGLGSGIVEPKFKPPLNGEHLYALYEGNWAFAIEMFIIFTRDNLYTFYEIQNFLQKDQFEEARKIVHKLITNLSMVGLLDASQMMLRLENLILGKKDKSDMIILYDQIAAHIQEAKPILQKTIEEFEAYFSINEINS